MAINKSAGNLKKDSATRDQLLADIRRIHKNFPDATITRDFYRQQGQYTDKAWSLYFPKFSNLVKESGCEPAAAPAVEVREAPVADKLNFEREKLAAKKEDTKKLLGEALHRINTLEQNLEVAVGLNEQTPQFMRIEPKTPSGNSEAAAFAIASDWHNEETVLPGDVNGLNEFNLDVFDRRSDKFFSGAQRLWEILRKDTDIKTFVLALLGDFITNGIHEDAAETNGLGPMEAVINVENKLASGIKFILENTDIEELIVPCHSGNHARTTKRVRIATEKDHSLETLMYYHLRNTFKDDPRVKFMIASGYLSYLDVFDTYLVRFHHGHQIRYQGGVGGITIPVNKAIDGWNKQDKYRNVRLDVFGHFHQYINYSNFVCNGSLIGYNAFAVAIKAPYEKPQQAFFLVSKKHNARSISAPIFLE